MKAAQSGRDEQTFYLYISPRHKSILNSGSVFYCVVGKRMASALCRLCAKEYSSKSGKPGFFLKPSADVDLDDQILLNEAIAWLNVYSGPDREAYDPPPPEDVMMRAEYAGRVHEWEVMIRRRENNEIGHGNEKDRNQILDDQRDLTDSLSGRAQDTTRDERSSFDLVATGVIAGTESTSSTRPKAKRGPKPRMDFHRAVAEVMKSFGMNWKEQSNLERIARELDRRKIPPLQSWLGRDRRARTWRRAAEYYSHLVRQALEYSLKMVAKDTTGKPSETLANLR
jgi:hypothetical protein